MIKSIFPMFFTPPVHALARRELDEAERSLLQAQSNAEYATSMVAYQRARVVRLKGYVAELGREAAKVSQPICDEIRAA